MLLLIISAIQVKKKNFEIITHTALSHYYAMRLNLLNSPIVHKSIFLSFSVFFNMNDLGRITSHGHCLLWILLDKAWILQQ